MAAKLIVTGDKAIDAIIRRIGDPKRTRAIVNRNMRAALKPILAAAKANVPKESGTFAKLIKIRTRRSRKGLILIIGFSKAELAAANADAPKNGFYPIAVEFGTDHQPAQAPMRLAFDANAETSRDQVLNGVARDVISADRS